MPNCFTLTRKGETEPEMFQTIDERMCKDLNVECDEVKWHAAWYDIVGLMLACGSTFDEIRTHCEHDEELTAVVNWLDEHYTSDAWAERGRH